MLPLPLSSFMNSNLLDADNRDNNTVKKKTSTSTRPLGIPRNLNALKSPVAMAMTEKLFTLPQIVVDEPVKEVKEEVEQKKTGLAKLPQKKEVAPSTAEEENPDLKKKKTKRQQVEPVLIKERRTNEDKDVYKIEEVDSYDSLDVCLEELQKSPYFDEYLKLLQKKKQPSGEWKPTSRAFIFSYFNFEPKLTFHYR